MRYENIELTGSLDISGSFIAPKGASLPSTGNTGDLFFNTTDKRLYEYRAEDGWNDLATQTTYIPHIALDYLVVAGGGSGGGWGGGAGAGGMLTGSLSEKFTSGSTLSAIIGAGASFNAYGTAGDADYQQGLNGSTSSLSSTSGTSFTTIDTVGGGGGGDYSSGAGTDGSDGGSGGGAASRSTSGTQGSGGAGTTGQGNDGGATSTSGNYYPGAGGGGGAGQAGQIGVGNTGGPGGSGSLSSITGTATYYAGGGSGHSPRTDDNPGTPTAPGGGGAGGRYQTAAGSTSQKAAQDGTANTGGGGGGGYGYQTYVVGKGGSGVVIVAYTTGSDDNSVQAAGGIKGDDGNGKQYHQFNTSGTLTVTSKSDLDVVSDGLVAHYDAGNFASRGTSTWTDLTGTSNGSVTNATLGQNFFYSFNGSGDYIDLGSIDTFSDGEYTMEAWCKVPAFSSPSLMSIFTLQDNIYAYMFIYANGSFRLNTETSSGTANLYTSTGYDDGNWHHVVATYTPGLLSAYVDNTADGTNTSGTGNPNSTDGWSLVGGYDSSKASLSQSYPLLGDVAQIRVYNKALSASEISQNYNATKHNFI